MGIYWIALIISIVEGLTEFIPVSSTGHMIIVGHAIGFTGPMADTFEVFIQLGAILAVVWIYRTRFTGLLKINQRGEGLSGRRGVLLLMVTTIPALFAGYLLHGTIKTHLFSPTTVAIGLAVGGVGIIAAEKWLPPLKKRGLDSFTLQDALIVGLFQCFALWPGMSRSGSTIVGGMLFGIERKTIAEYSFLAAVPVMVAATSYDLLKSWHHLQPGDIPVFAFGFICSFIAAVLAVKFFLGFLSRHTLSGFGVYRIILSAVTIWYFHVFTG